MTVYKINKRKEQTVQDKYDKDTKELLLKIQRQNSKMFTSKVILTEILSPLLAIILSIITFATDLISEVDSPLMKGVVIILVLSIAFYNIARGIRKLRGKDDDNNDNP